MKHLLFAAVATAALSAAPAIAEHRHHGMGHGMHGMHHEMSAEDMSAFSDARLASLKAGLKMTPEQEKNWPSLETALRDSAKAQADHMAEMHKTMDDKQNAIDMLRHRAGMMTTRAAQLTKIADAAKPLYDSLDDGQKNRFGVLLRQTMMGMRHGMMMGRGMKRDNDD